MAKIYAGRYAAKIDGSFVVFLIGLRINQLWAVHKWLPTGSAMGPMLSELYRNPSLGFLGAHTAVSWRRVTVTQYWRSFEHLVAYAQARDAKHLPAWKAFNQRVGADGSVGIWHETYRVEPGHYECIYANMPLFGLASVGELVPASGPLHAAQSRMGN